EPAPPAPEERMLPAERLRRLVMVVATILAPVPEKSLMTNSARYRELGKPRAAVNELINSGELEKEKIDGITYVWPHRKGPLDESSRRVRFLSPFDPLAWVGHGFEHLWS